MMPRILLDTSILIQLTNKNNLIPALADLLKQKPSIWVSSVSLNEYIRGCHDKYSLEVGLNMVHLFEGNIMTPNQTQWIECAKISERLLKIKKRSKLDVLLLQNDILIALGAQSASATLITTDKDFKLIQQFIPVSIEWW